MNLDRIQEMEGLTLLSLLLTAIPLLGLAFAKSEKAILWWSLSTCITLPPIAYLYFAIAHWGDSGAGSGEAFLTLVASLIFCA